MDAFDELTKLITQFAAWATRKGRQPDLDLLTTLLDLRASYDDLAPTYWPPGSVEDLLLDLWPAKGPTEVPEAAITVETLDAFVRFLRSTGRMTSRSAEPAVLLKEARRAANAMARVATDPINWSPTKVMLDFGRGMGIRLDGASDPDTVQLRLRQIQELWNDLPVDERRRLMPKPGDAPPKSGREAAMEQWGIDEPTVALLMTFRDRLPSGRLPEDNEVAPYFSQSAFGRQMLALAEWVGDGREITGTGVLRPAEAKQAYSALGLGVWQRRLVELEYPDERLPGVAKVGRQAWIERELSFTWRSAGDVVELHRLWLGATASGLILLNGKHAIGAGEPPLDATRWVEVGVRSVVAAMSDVLRRPGNRVALIWSILESYVGGCRPVALDEAMEFQDAWHFAPGELQSDESTWRAWREPSIDAALAQLDDTGIYTYRDGWLQLTPAGDVFVTAWLKHMESWTG